MEALWVLIPALGCGLVMVACMVMMGRMMGGHRNPPSEHDEVQALRDEVAQLRAERDATDTRSDG
jgi:hypothetical protein